MHPLYPGRVPGGPANETGAARSLEPDTRAGTGYDHVLGLEFDLSLFEPAAAVDAGERTAACQDRRVAPGADPLPPIQG